ncbi:hypothetical protein [Nocardioides sp.]|uniref:hypothetical protein n=1 Tax=Nocardioides sp. TaxID=35761 RepID=UPI00356B308C
MTRNRVLYAIALVASLALVAAGVYRQVDGRRIDTAPTAAAAVSLPEHVLAPTPLTVSLSRVTSSPTAAIGSPSAVSVNVAGPEISQVRVFDGSVLVGIQTFDPPRHGRVSLRVDWPAVREGAHLLHAEAVGAGAQEVGHSAPMRIRAVPGVVAPKTVDLPANGRTPQQIAQGTGVPLAALTYTSVTGKPVAAPRPNAPLSSQVVASAPLNRVSSQAPPPAPVPGRPAPRARLDGCRVSVSPPASEAATIYEMTGGGLGFLKRGVATTGTPYVSDDLTPGPHIFVAGAGDDPADSAPVSVEVPATCLSSAWTGEASLLDGELTLPEPQPRVWVYLGVDGGAFQRYPATGSVSGAFGVADLAGSLPSLRGKELRMEVWRAGRTPSDPAVRVAQSSLNVADPDSLGELLGEAPSVEFYATDGGNAVEMDPTDTSAEFGWHTESLLLDGVIWQVLGRPLLSGDRNTAPPVLLATGFSPNGDGPGIVLSGRGGTFKIPADLLLGGRPVSAIGDGTLSQVPTPSVQQLVSPGSAFGTTPLRAPITGSVATLPAGLVPVPVGDVYVRVLPVAGEAVLGDASNTVAVTLPPLSPTDAGFTAASVTFEPGHAANPALSNCVRITGTPQDGAIRLYASDKTYCPSDFAKKGGGCHGWCQIAKDAGSLVEFVTQVWDYIALAYNTVVDTVVTVIAKFNPYCLTASVTAAVAKSPYASAAADGCAAIATVVASVAVAAVMSAVGLPPRLPTSAQVLDVAEGNLTSIAVAYLEQLGVPCSKMRVDPSTVQAVGATGVDVPAGAKGPDGAVDLCAAMIDQAVGAIRGEVKKAADAEVANLTGLLVPPAPQQYELEPRGRYHGAEVRIVAQPIDAKTPKTARCFVTANGSVPQWDVGGFEQTRVRLIGVGSGAVAYNPLSGLGAGPAWHTSIRMRPIDDLYDTETIAVTLTSPCFAPGSLKPIQATPLKPALDRWLPGQAD